MPSSSFASFLSPKKAMLEGGWRDVLTTSKYSFYRTRRILTDGSHTDSAHRYCYLNSARRKKYKNGILGVLPLWREEIARKNFLETRLRVMRSYVVWVRLVEFK